MEVINWTPEQFQAIHASGSSILVSAAAGAGKTTVLISRIMEQILFPENHTNISDYLIITYTRAAADELKNKIMKEIGTRCSEEPNNLHLQRQLILCKKAKINTIHGICSEWLREHAQLAGISPDFRIAEEDECKEIKEAVLQKVLESAYSKSKHHSSFLSVFELMVTSAGDDELQNAVMEIYEDLRSHPEPQKWIFEQMDAIQLHDVNDAADTIWGKEILKQVRRYTEEGLAFSKQLFEDSRNSELTQKFRDNAEEIFRRFQILSDSLDNGWDSIRSAINFTFPKLMPSKKIDCSKLISLKNMCSTILKRIKPLLITSSDDLILDMKTVGIQAQGLYELVRDFDNAYSAEKARRGILDFSDLEHKTAQLVYNFNENKRSEAAIEISERYYEIMVDEYQDVNEIQELILTSVSRNESNLFMVGDVKQSIYRFRLADPSIFLNKYYSYSDYPPENKTPSRILLPQNFRSSFEIISGINDIFKVIMSKSLGDIDYGPKEALKYGRQDIPSGEAGIYFHFSCYPNLNTEEIRQNEAEIIAKRILDMVSKGECISENGITRPLAYQDFAILLRSAKQRSTIYTDALTKFGIPWTTEQGEDLLACREVSLILHCLDVIDNPDQDIALIDVLHSPFVGFSYDELSEMRYLFGKGSLFQALKQYSYSNKKAFVFLNRLNYFREISCGLSVDRLLVILFEELDAASILKACGYLNTEEHLFALLQYAVSFESKGFQGLFRFQNHISYRRKNGGIVTEHALGGQGVHLLTIHKSKGLEYPVVILADTAAKINKSDSANTVLFHKDLGIGLEARDSIKKVKYKTLARLAIQNKLTSEMLSEEVRVLYVALTRAKDKLFIFASENTTVKYLNILNMGKFALNPISLSGMSSTSEWIFSAVSQALDLSALYNAESDFSLEDGPWKFEYQRSIANIIADQDTKNAALDIPFSEIYDLNPGIIVPEFKKYAFVEAVDLPSKVTATNLIDTNDSNGQVSAALFPSETVFRKPDFSENRKKLSGAEKGTALHTALQHLRFDKCTEINSLNIELDRLVKKGFLSEKQALSIDRSKIIQLFQSETGKELLSQPHLNREFNISILLNAEDLMMTGGKEQVLFQGVIDCWYEEPDGISIIDFKTDIISGNNLEKKISKYTTQINYYALALNKITGKPIKSKILYFFDKSLEIIV